MTQSVAPRFRVRPLANGDRDAVLAIAAQCGFDLDLEGEAQRPWAEVWVAIGEGGVPVAYALLWRVADELELQQIATAVTARRSGAAFALLGSVLGEMPQRGFSAVYLEVRARNEAALGLYARLGFEKTRTRKGYYSDGEDAVEMRLGVG
jgi:[ribosomal protein S18]-alanine N-acetyltransferase